MSMPADYVRTKMNIDANVCGERDEVPEQKLSQWDRQSINDSSTSVIIFARASFRHRKLDHEKFRVLFGAWCVLCVCVSFIH